MAIVEESQYAKRKDRKEAIATVVGNVGKTDGLVLFPTNAPHRGGGSYADEQLVRVERGENAAIHVFYRQLPEPLEEIRGTDAKPSVMAALEYIYGEAATGEFAWVNLERVYRNMMTTSERRARRLYLNEPTAPEGSMVDPDRWAMLERADVSIPDGSMVCLGFDGSEAEDATALVAVSCTSPPHVETVGVWRRPEGVEPKEWRVPKGEVMSALRKCRERWKVEGLVADPSIAWKSFITEIADDEGEGWGMVAPSKFGDRTKREGWNLVVEIWMNNSPKLTDMLVAHAVGLLDSDDVTFTHDGHELLTAHALGMVRVPVRNGAFESVDKKSEAQKDQIDAGVAAILALWGAAQFPVAGGGVDADWGGVTADDGAGSLQDAVAGRMRGRAEPDGEESVQDAINRRMRGG